MQHWIDLRSDTVTLPTDGMRSAMANAVVGDDVYEDDPTVNSLQEKAAGLLGKEAALFVPSGTMGNQLSILCQTARGEEIICEENSHILQHERAAAAMLSQVMPKALPSSDGIMDIESLRRAIRPKDVHYPKTSLICLENALGNGTVAPLSYMEAVRDLASDNGIRVHLDGARLFHAATYLGCEASALARHCDSVTFCLSKGLAAPVGSLLVGTRDFIDCAKEYRKSLGGGMRQAGILAAAGHLALDEMRLRLQEDHDNARYLAERLLELGYTKLDLASVHINMVFFRFDQDIEKVAVLHEFLLREGIKINPMGSNYGDEFGLLRFVTHHNISRADIDRTVGLIASYFAG